ncbi:FG-GAP repeat protein [Streptomyces sp. TP-A0874]|uniref:FG-GAP repeat protein n=1 Tax=Streptomyces sp. TP-A0874 TaxID=549819 RepID=UPI000853C0C6|nr:FG-GAP repeat protein [Streptomyces sp. TP-A0874]
MPRRLRTALLAAIAGAALVGGLLTTAGEPASAAPAGIEGDFNGDSVRDVVISAPYATVDGAKEAGAVVVLYGARHQSLSEDPSRRVVISQNSPGVPGAAEAGDLFGAATAAGDFNGDGYTDLAVGTPGEDVTGDDDAGLVQILWGSAHGLAAGAPDGLPAGTTLPEPASTSHDRFGAALAAGDFHGTGHTSLATGDSSATVRIFQGPISPASGAPAARQAVPTPVLAGGEHGVQALTAGDMTADGRAELIVHGLGATASGGKHPGAAYYLPGSPDGPDGSAVRTLPGGLVSAIGDVDGDSYGDLVVGAPLEPGAEGAAADATKGGRVSLVRGSASGPSGAVEHIDQESGDIPGGSETGDAFGWSVTLGDIDGDGLLDLAIGAPGEDIRDPLGTNIMDTGSVTVVYGSPDGLDTGHVQYFHQDTPQIPGADETGDRFGAEVFLADLNADNRADLTIGADGENDGNGAALSLLSDGNELHGIGSVYFSTTAAGVDTAGKPRFGRPMAG